MQWRTFTLLTRSSMRLEFQICNLECVALNVRHGAFSALGFDGLRQLQIGLHTEEALHVVGETYTINYFSSNFKKRSLRIITVLHSARWQCQKAQSDNQCGSDLWPGGPVFTVYFSSITTTYIACSKHQGCSLRYLPQMSEIPSTDVFTTSKLQFAEYGPLFQLSDSLVWATSVLLSGPIFVPVRTCSCWSHYSPLLCCSAGKTLFYRRPQLNICERKHIPGKEGLNICRLPVL